MSAPVRVGELFAGKYQVERIIGQGGMGIVFSAIHVHLKRRVAVKFLLPELVHNQEIVTRFVREARAAVSIESEHVARVMDVGETDAGVPFMVMEYLNGADLSSVLAKRGFLSVQEAVDYVLQACEAIAEAHRLGIVHRDLKPANLFLTTMADGSSKIKVLDFGISKVTSGVSTSMPITQVASMLGSPLYMSPEQMRSSSRVDQRTDIWALGVILFEALTGEVPFPGEGLHEVMTKVIMDPVPSLRALRFDLPAELEAVVFQCLQKNPTERYSNVAQLAAALEKFGSQPAAHLSVQLIFRMQRAGMTSLPDSPPPGPSESPTRVEGSSTGVAIGGVASSHVSSNRGEKSTPPNLPNRSASSTLRRLAAVLAAAFVLGGFALVMVWRGVFSPAPAVSSVSAEPPALSATGVSAVSAPTQASSSAPSASAEAVQLIDEPAPEASAPPLGATHKPPLPSSSGKTKPDKSAAAATTSSPPTPPAPTPEPPSPPPATTKKNPLSVDIK